MITKVNFFDIGSIDDRLLKFAVIISRSDDKWIFCKHKKRTTYEIPGGHREQGESILETANRELREETGAVDYYIMPIFAYSVANDEDGLRTETFGMVYFAQIKTFEKELHSEIEKICLLDRLPMEWTYPEIQPKIIEHFNRLRKSPAS